MISRVIRWEQRARLVAEAETTDFVRLVSISGLDPARDFRGADLSGVNFSYCDLEGFDFRGAVLDGCQFENANIENTLFDSAARLRILLETKQSNFTELFGKTGFDPKRDARYADWSGVSFAGEQLHEYDFTGSELVGCDFDGTYLSGQGWGQGGYGDGRWGGYDPARLDQATLGRVMYDPDREATLPAVVSLIANIREAADWEEFCKPSNWTKPTTPHHDGHLPSGAIIMDTPFAPEMVVVPPGTFIMGESGRMWDSAVSPAHKVTIGYHLAVGRFPVTFDEWLLAYNDGGVRHLPNSRGWGTDRTPVMQVSWHDAMNYCAWLSNKTGLNYRLLNEAEWEYCCRAGTTTRYSFGETLGEENANLRYLRHTTKVGRYPPNAFGLHDMHGNVAEWCADNWHEDYEDDPPCDGSVWRGGQWNRYVIRGGSWNDSHVGSAHRDRSHPSTRNNVIGFRIARTTNL